MKFISTEQSIDKHIRRAAKEMRIGDDVCYVSADGTLTIIMANAIADTVITYRLSSSGNELIVIDEIGMDFTVDDEMVFYKKSGNGETVPISEDEYYNSPLWPENYDEKHGDLVFIPLFKE